MTPRDLITLALKQSGVLGVGQTASAEDMNDAFSLLQMMMAQWQRKRWLVYTLQDVSFVGDDALSYSIGIGGDINVARPDRIEAAFVRLLNQATPNQTDQTLIVLQSREDYNRITLKHLSPFPIAVYYDPTFPLGTVYPWPLPSSLYEIHLTVKVQLQQFTGLTDEFELPPEYEAAILYNLAARLRPAYQLPQDPSVTALATDALNVIRNANAQIPRLRIPVDLRGPGSTYNPYSDTLGGPFS